jgi:polyisoprenyl-phosphate glycosyltransferase
MDRPTYSVVIPIYNERANLDELARRLTDLFPQLDGSAEVIFVDDGSDDGSIDRLMALGEADSRFKVIQLSRNFGHQIAITAGLDYALGDAVAIMDGDLQDPPEMIVGMATKWREGFEVVYAIRESRQGESRFKQATARFFYRGLKRITDVDAPLDVGDFRLVDRKAIEAFKAMRENNRYVRGMFSWIGFRQTGVAYTRAERYAGKTKYSFKNMMRFALDAVIGFSNAPLRATLNLGFLLAGLSFIGGIVALVMKISGAYVVPGWASIVSIVAFLGGIQLIVLGIMGEYIARIHDEVKNRPLYLVRDVRGFREETWSAPRRVISSSLPTVDDDPDAGKLTPGSRTP